MLHVKCRPKLTTNAFNHPFVDFYRCGSPAYLFEFWLHAK